MTNTWEGDRGHGHKPGDLPCEHSQIASGMAIGDVGAERLRSPCFRAFP